MTTRRRTPLCLTRSKKLRKHAHYALHGDYGDGRFCTLNCGYIWAIRNAPQPGAVGAPTAREEGK